MRLEELAMRRAGQWDTNAGKMSGKVKFAKDGNEITLIIDEAACQKILALCAEGVVAQSQAVARELTAAVIESSANMIKDQR